MRAQWRILTKAKSWDGLPDNLNLLYLHKTWDMGRGLRFMAKLAKDLDTRSAPVHTKDQSTCASARATCGYDPTASGFMPILRWARLSHGGETEPAPLFRLLTRNHDHSESICTRQGEACSAQSRGSVPNGPGHKSRVALAGCVTP